VTTVFSTTTAEFIETHRGGKAIHCKYYRICEGKKVKCLGRGGRASLADLVTTGPMFWLR